MSERELTRKEQQAVRKLMELAEDWPKTLWLFTNGQGVSIMRLDKDGKRAVTKTGCFDPDYAVETINLPADGGDW